MRTVPLFLAFLLGAVASHPTAEASGLRPIRLRADAGRVKRGTEKQTCFPINFPGNQTVDVDHVQIFVQ